MVKLSTLQPGQIAAENWAYPTSIMPRRWQDLAAVKALFYKKAETLGTDGGVGTPTITHGIESAGYPLYSRLTTSAALNDTAYSYSSHGIARLQRLPAGVASTRLMFECQALLSQIATTFLSLGFTSFLVKEPAARCVHLFYDSGVGANWQARSYESAEEQTDTGVAADTALHIFQIRVSSANVLFYIDGTVVATHTTEIPDGGLESFMANATVLLWTNAAAVRYARYTHVAVWLE